MAYLQIRIDEKTKNDFKSVVGERNMSKIIVKNIRRIIKQQSKVA